MSIIFVDGFMTDSVYYARNKDQRTCKYCSKCNAKNFTDSMYAGRCDLSNLRKFEDDWCDKFIKK